jgi:SAM-dependent MidA family methyltransferase
MPAVTNEHRITFAAYMEQALYGPEGYYSSGIAHSGRTGDYFTAPDTGPAFGMLLSAIFAQWARQFAARPFHLIECGAGEGALAQGMIQSLQQQDADLCRHLRYDLVERSMARRRILDTLMGNSPVPVQVVGQLDELKPRPVAGVLFANELIDAMPVHRVRMHKGRLEEAYVVGAELSSAHPREVWESPSTPDLADYFDRLNITLPEGYVTEVNLAMRSWIRQAATVLNPGFLVAIDYGRPAWQYYDSDRREGTLRGFREHEVRRDVLAPDVADITADVDFTSLAIDGQQAGFQPLAFMEMGPFLMQGARAILDQGDFKAAAPAGLRYLVHPEGMGSAFHVLVMGKGIDPKDWIFEHNRLPRLGLQNLE